MGQMGLLGHGWLKMVLMIMGIWWGNVGMAQPLTVGDRLPKELSVSNVVNDGGKGMLALGQLDGRALLLDFWASWCGKCVSDMDKMAGFQKEFSDRLRVVQVTPQDRAGVEAFFARHPTLAHLGLPMVTGDSVLLGLFPCVGVPHLVWVDKAGVVRAITGAEEAERENIAKLVSGVALNLPIKKDLVDFDHTKAFSFPEGLPKELLCHSSLTGEKEGVRAFRGFSHPASDFFRVHALNIGLAGLYKQAYGLYIRFAPLEGIQRIVASVGRAKEQLVSEKGYCYEGIIKGGGNAADKKKLLDRMATDLDRTFGLRSGVVKRATPCLVVSLQNTGIVIPVSASGVKPVSGKNIAAYLYQYLDSTLPVVFEGNGERLYMLDIHGTDRSLVGITAELQRQGFSLTVAERTIEMLEIRDKECGP